MQAWPRIVLIGIAAMLFGQPIEAIGIRGSASCGVWVEDHAAVKNNPNADRAIVAMEQSWLVAYLSGRAVGENKDFWGKKDVNMVDNQSVFLWVDNYCKAHPLEQLFNAADALFEERIKKK